jgi:N-acetylmuramic acid 6-phosphate (MurNAc-6-P) etherase
MTAINTADAMSLFYDVNKSHYAYFINKPVGDKKMKTHPILLFFLIGLCSLFIMPLSASGQETPSATKTDVRLLQLLGITPSSESIDYIQSKTQFQLHTLLTEQRHSKTWDLSKRIQKDSKTGLQMLFSVDEDIVQKLDALSKERGDLEQAVRAIEEALLSNQKIYIYGCGATGRLAKQMESSFWRPFWKNVKSTKKIWQKIQPHLGEAIESRLIGEMTGGDRALISSLEGFEDLQLIGHLQLEDRKVKRGDVVICVTEGGETSSVIGTILSALDQWKKANVSDPAQTRKKLYFIYNNPDERLLPFDRSRTVLEEPGITKINLTTGPQAITGSTRMQATTIETFVVGNILQAALDRILRKYLSSKEMEKLGFITEQSLRKKLGDFSQILKQVQANRDAVAKFTLLEAQTYSTGHYSTYFAQEGLITVFIDSTERSPTFRLFPLDTVKEGKRKCWIQVWTPSSSLQDAWKVFLGRPFRGLASPFYKVPFEEKIEDAYLKRAALESLKNAGDDQQHLYDFSLSDFNLKNRGPRQGDLGVVVCIQPELDDLKKKNSEFRKFIDLFTKSGANVTLVLITDKFPEDVAKLIKKIPGIDIQGKDSLVAVHIKRRNDPLGINQQIALKILLNAHSTAVMARLGKVIGNTMTNVSPSNLKLIGRATYLIQSHVNDTLSRPQWVKLNGIQKPISYGEANAVLFDTINFLKDKKEEAGQTAEVALSIIRILESFRLKKNFSNTDALKIVKQTGLNQYLSNVTSESN